MAFTPFPDDTRENPSIVVSQDGIRWLVPDGATNPVVSAEEVRRAGYRYNSDPELVLTADGQMLLYYRPFSGGGNEAIFCKRSRNGVAWSSGRTVLSCGRRRPADAPGTGTRRRSVGPQGSSACRPRPSPRGRRGERRRPEDRRAEAGTSAAGACRGLGPPGAHLLRRRLARPGPHHAHHEPADRMQHSPGHGSPAGGWSAIRHR
jgi:hypothetical protein